MTWNDTFLDLAVIFYYSTCALGFAASLINVLCSLHIVFIHHKYKIKLFLDVNMRKFCSGFLSQIRSVRALLEEMSTNLNLHEFEDFFLSFLKQSSTWSIWYRCENVVHSGLFLWIQIDPWGNLIHCHPPLPLVLGYRLLWYTYVQIRECLMRCFPPIEIGNLLLQKTKHFHDDMIKT